MSEALERLIARELDAAPSPSVATCGAHFAAHFGLATAAVLFYGGGLRTPEAGALLDFYVVTDDLHMLPPVSRLGAHLLPPNVYAFSVEVDGRRQACKVAVLTMAAFIHGMRAFAPHLWARFAQPTSLAYARDETAKACVRDALVTAIKTAVMATSPLLPARFSAEELWRRIFMETYAAELRPESADRAAAIVSESSARYLAITDAMSRADRPRHPMLARIEWFLRRRWGKLLNAARLIKASFTFAGGLDYGVAKIARHSGVHVAITEADRRLPLLGGIRIFLEARRKGGVS